MTETISTRVSPEMASDLEEIEKEEKADRATVVRKLLAKAIADRKLERALSLFSSGKVTLWKASKVAGLHRRCSLDAISTKK